MYTRLACRAASLPPWTVARPALGAPTAGNGARRPASAYGAASDTTKTVASSSTLLMKPLQRARLAGTWEPSYAAWGTGVRYPQAIFGGGQFCILSRGGSRRLSTQEGRGDAGGVDKKAERDDMEDEAGKGSEEDYLGVIVALKEDLAKSQEQLQDGKEKVLYLAAEMENVRAIAKRDVLGARRYAVQKFAKQLLDVADNLERAVGSAKEDGGSEGDSSHLVLLQGVEMTSDELQKVFRSQGLEKYGEEGDKFDPHLHDAMFAYPDPAREPGTVGQVLKYGYKLHGRVIRASQVGTIRDA